MSYEPLHHKYRPKSFVELVGQEAIATTLTNAIRTAKIAPAYLFTGPRGTGKTSSARILAKSLNCLHSHKPTPEPCGVCDVCQGITKGYSLDVIEIDAASNTGVDNIRELIEKAQFAPVQCRYKVYVVDECHMLSTAAFNALLKTLEEPPKHVVFVLATTDPQRVLPTIISRCQRFDFRRIQLETMVKHLSAIASKEKINISADALTLIAQIAQGGLRDAESLLDQLALCVGEVTPDQVWDLVGSVSEQDLLSLLHAIAQNHPEAVLDSTRKILDSGREPLIILQNLAAFYRDLLIAKTAPKRQDLVACTQPTWTALVEFSQQLDMRTILLGQEHLRASEVQIKNTTQPRLWLEVTLLGLLASANQPETKSTDQRVSTPALGTNYRPVVSSSPQPTSQNTTVKPTPTTPEPLTHSPARESSEPASPQEVVTPSEYNLTQVWQQVLVNIQMPSRQALLGQMCQIIEFNGDKARIAVKGTWLETLKSDLPMIKAAFQQTFQREIEIYLEKGTSSTHTSRRKNPQLQDSTPVQKPPAPKYNQQIQSFTPTTQAQVPTPTPTKTESTTSANKVKPLPQPPQPTTQVDWETDEVAIAAQRLAEFFSGQVIRFTENGVDSPESMTTSDWMDESELDDE
ncbi:DNA polymerase III subunit gamma/tau [Umezakia ovalisporum]|jgi:DNA polymerase-3 subunit gamma/tau|uniref:DNA polymerase III subunit gamma/tau n=1 Tax=Umezakia ovalisporum FSS-62 TaxID=2971776 RepID=A0AA43GVN4_9CYAN|nr:DNA polymerase III subunit gamma/tau [Umezakia ovalisporum]MBI1243001.1 DNA polymerase III subunit gamma/tau [Nostoc sp. RI_552]MDH6062470.1 DNA polymerase III subunit gamma/tau [Umezakia ovalisporum FSS-62]MDH6068527.1 DNA polymerase III subunit gamma/tau [Umezakia ovalisporum APH033B]MDH6078381.1 DNA polymerase III subunit gamma/tau [Umezakia ovalisporum FSS-45]MDH6085150.1 DNA polymerase III subunit gamma/tau [Umezakia ovalisporum TAC611]